MWNVTSYVDTVPPIAESELMGMWELGNWVVACRFRMSLEGLGIRLHTKPSQTTRVQGAVGAGGRSVSL
jgi:hypothetical protein